MAIIEIEDVETALGESIPVDDELRVQWYIDTVCAFILKITNYPFEEAEDVEHITRANSWGCIEFPTLTAVSNVEPLDYTYDDYYVTSGWLFDGIDTIYNLSPYGTYRVTVTYGETTVPDDIKGVAAQLVLAGTGYDVSAVNGLTKMKTGNVEDTYGVSPDGSVTLAGFMRDILDSYDTGYARP